MALSERSRAVLYRSLTSIARDDQAVTGRLSISNVAQADGLATKDFVRAEIHGASNHLLVWMIGLNATQLGLIVARTR